MTSYEPWGMAIRSMSKKLVLEFMRSRPDCQPGKIGMRLSQIFRECGFDWGDYPKTTSSNQQYWVGAIVQELSKEDKIERVGESGPWRLK